MMKKGLPFEVAAQKVQMLVSGFSTVFDMWRCHTCGRLYATENSAAYCHASDRKCLNCDNRTESKGYAYCRQCLSRRSRQRWEDMPEAEWDGEEALALHDSDQYFFNAEELADYCGEEAIEVDDLMLVVCKRVRPPCFNLHDFLSDLLPDDKYPEDFGIDVAATEKVVNDAVAKVAESVWEPGSRRPSLKSIRNHLGVSQ